MHLILDGYEGNRDRLGDFFRIQDLLSRWPAMCGMNVIAGPHVTQYDGGERTEDWGISGSVIIAESHIAIHTWPDQRLVWVDCFSCRDFDPAVLAESVVQEFLLQKAEILELARGLGQSGFRKKKRSWTS